MTGAAYARITVGQPMAGLFIAPQQAALTPIIDCLLLVWAASEAEESHNQVRYLPF